MESTKVNGGDSQVSLKINALASSVIVFSPSVNNLVGSFSLVWVSRCARLVVEALITDSNKVVAIKRLDIRGHFLSPAGNRGGGATSGGCPVGLSVKADRI